MNFGIVSAATSGTSAYRDDDEVMENADTSNPGMISAILSFFGRFNCIVHHWVTCFWQFEPCTAPNIIDLPDDDEESERPLARRNRRAPVSEAL